MKVRLTDKVGEARAGIRPRGDPAANSQTGRATAAPPLLAALDLSQATMSVRKTQTPRYTRSLRLLEMMRSVRLVGKIALLGLLGATSACQREEGSPKPKGYFRIDLPKVGYRQYKADCPFTFDYATAARVQPDSSRQTRPCWLNVEYPQFKGRINLTYYPLGQGVDLSRLTEDSRTLTFRHSIRAEAIDELPLNYPERKVYGLLYAVGGEAASAVQFYATDSTRHFLRGSLYFDAEPNTDSLAPVLKFVQADVVRLLKTLEWKVLLE